MDIEPNTVKGLKGEFDEYCNEDEALTIRRLKYAPTYSLDYTCGRCEVKRKQVFKGGEMVYVDWTPLNLQVSTENFGISWIIYEHSSTQLVKVTWSLLACIAAASASPSHAQAPASFPMHNFHGRSGP